MEGDLQRLLATDDTLPALVPGLILWGSRDQSNSALPAIVLQRVYGGRDYHMAGASGLVESRVQADVYAERYNEAKDAARALIARVNGYSGTYGETQFQRISIDSERDSVERESDADRQLFRTSIDLLIWHDE